MALLEPLAATTCLWTTVRCIAAAEKFFGFLAPHGRRLACGEELNQWGDLQSWTNRFTPNERARRSLEECLGGSDPQLVLVKTPAVHLYDETLDNTKILDLDNGTFAAIDPCWGAYDSNSVEC